MDGVRYQLSTQAGDTGEIEQGIVRVSSDHQLMLLSESGAALILIGPAKLVSIMADNVLTLVLEDGRLIVAAVWPEEDVRPLSIALPGDTQGTPLFEAVASPGISYFQRQGDAVGVGFVSESDMTTSMAMRVMGRPRSINSGEVITIVGGEIQTGPAEAWLSEQRFDNAWGQSLGVASAQAARPSLESSLFSNITEWDVFGGEEYVTSRLEAGRFRPEIRQVVSSISTPRRTGSTMKAAPKVSGFPAANEVPVLSPAALSVINPLANVTAIQLNLQARGLLTDTGSRGLGWRGQSQLAISGLFGGGTPTVGPAGLGAQ